jgi:hypothetical protein
MGLDEVAAVVADIEDDPDDQEPAKAQKKRLDEIAEDVTIEKLHSAGGGIQRLEPPFAKRKVELDGTCFCVSDRTFIEFTAPTPTCPDFCVE